MLIYDRTSLMNYEYQLNDEQIQKFLHEFHQKGLPSLFLVEKSQKPIAKHKWVKAASQLGINLVLVREFHCFTPYFDKKMPLLFIMRDNREYNIIKRITRILKSQYLPFLNHEALSYLERLQIPVWYIHNHKVFDLRDNVELGDAPKLPLPLKEYTQVNVFNNSIIIDFDTLFSQVPSVSYQQTKSTWSTEEESPLRLLEEIIDFSSVPTDELPRIHEEIKWMAQHNHQQVFWLAHQLAERHIPVLFKGDFFHFLLSYHLGLIKRKPSTLFSLDASANPKYIFMGSPFHKHLIYSEMDKLLKQINSAHKYPFQKDKLLFSSVMEWFRKRQQDIDVDTMVLYKDKYDGLSEEEKICFFEEMKLYFLLYPDAEKAFKHALYLLEKNIHKKWHQSEKIAIVNPGDYDEPREDSIDIDIEELNEHLCPIITMYFTKIDDCHRK